MKTIKDYELCDTLWKKFRGLMFRKTHDKTLLFIFNKEARFKNSIHSFFVFFTFDAVWIDEDMKIVDMNRVEPFTGNVTPLKPAKYLLEVPVGKANRFKLGDKVKINGIS